jgi:hypothetical protein
MAATCQRLSDARGSRHEEQKRGEPMLTYLNDPALKAALVAEITKHQVADQIVKGTYGRTNGVWRGCAIGCSLHSLNVLQGRADLSQATGDHARYESELGLPLWLAYLEDHVFETLSETESQTWPRVFAEAIPVGVTIPDRLLAKILRWTLAAETVGVRHATDDVEIIAVIDRMVALFDREIAGDSPTAAEWNEDAWAARAARAAWAAWAAWAARAAWDEPLHTGAKAALFTTALARYVVEELRALAS